MYDSDVSLDDNIIDKYKELDVKKKFMTNIVDNETNNISVCIKILEISY